MQKIYNFDKVIQRRGTGAVKTDRLAASFGSADLLPLWVADMDFETPDFIVDALNRRMQHPIFGYTMVPESYWQSILDWQQSLHGWNIDREWLTFVPGIVKGIGFVVNVFTRPGDKIIIQPPVYHPFRIVPEANGRIVVNNPLRLTEKGYEMDFEQLSSIIDSSCKVLILSNPHNPGGMVWSAETLRRLAEICSRHGILVIADEIHSDLALYGHRHVPFASVSEQAAQCSITFGAPSKTFNIAGIVSSFAVVPNPAIRQKFYGWLEANELTSPTLFAPIATEAAFTHGAEWRRQMLCYLEGNIDFIHDFISTHIPLIRVMKPQASFLVWLDCRLLGLDHEHLLDLFIKKAGLALNDGEMFGPGGEGFMRLNVGTSRSVLEQAMIRLKEAVNALTQG